MKILKNRNANWNIAKINTIHVSASQTSSKFKLNLEQVFIKDGEIIYDDEITGISTSIRVFGDCFREIYLPIWPT